MTGLITADWYLMEHTSGKPKPERRHRLAAVLARAGASPELADSARVIVMHPAHHSRHGSGFIRTGVLHVRV